MKKPKTPVDDTFAEAFFEESEPVSKTDELTNYMASLAFSSKAARMQDTLEYAKNYTDPSGRIGRVAVIVKKDLVGLEPDGVDFFTITMQLTVSANEDEVEKKAPAFCRQDLRRILAHMGTKNERQDADVQVCGMCFASTNDYALVNGDAVCLNCVRKNELL